MSLCRASRIDPCLDSCSPAEPGFLLGLAPSQLDMTGMKIRAVRAEGCRDRSAPAAVLDASRPVALGHPRDPPRTGAGAAWSIHRFPHGHLGALKAPRGLLLRGGCWLQGCSSSVLLL